MESLIENYLGGRHTLMYMNMTLGMYHPCKGVAREAGNDVVCYCSQQSSSRSFGFAFTKLMLGGMTPASRVRMVLMRPASPAPASRCPMLGFTLPMYRGTGGVVVVRLKIDPIALTSRGSPAPIHDQ